MPRKTRSAPETAPAHPPLADRGRMLSADDVLALLPKKPDGRTPVKSRYWVLNYFLPDKKHKLGRDPYWWESEVVTWLDSTESAAA